MSNIFSNLQAETEKQQKLLAKQPSPTPQHKSSEVEIPTLEPTQKSTQESDTMREMPRNISRDNPRELPTRDEVQEFSFRLRDELKVKVQAEVPYQWQKELEDLAREMDVKKLELYRFIIGEFLGKVRRSSSQHQEGEKEPKSAH